MAENIMLIDTRKSTVSATGSIGVIQNANRYLKNNGKNAAFKDWVYKLNRGDTLPRGKFFKGKKKKRVLFVIDEAHLLFN